MRTFDDGTWTLPGRVYSKLDAALEPYGFLPASIWFSIDEKRGTWTPPRGKIWNGDITITLKCRVVKDAPPYRRFIPRRQKGKKANPNPGQDSGDLLSFVLWSAGGAGRERTR